MVFEMQSDRSHAGSYGIIAHPKTNLLDADVRFLEFVVSFAAAGVETWEASAQLDPEALYSPQRGMDGDEFNQVLSNHGDCSIKDLIRLLRPQDLSAVA